MPEAAAGPEPDEATVNAFRDFSWEIVGEEFEPSPQRRRSAAVASRRIFIAVAPEREDDEGTRGAGGLEIELEPDDLDSVEQRRRGVAPPTEKGERARPARVGRCQAHRRRTLEPRGERLTLTAGRPDAELEVEPRRTGFQRDLERRDRERVRQDGWERGEPCPGVRRDETRRSRQRGEPEQAVCPPEHGRSASDVELLVRRHHGGACYATVTFF